MKLLFPEHDQVLMIPHRRFVGKTPQSNEWLLMSTKHTSTPSFTHTGRSGVAKILLTLPSSLWLGSNNRRTQGDCVLR